MLNIEPETIAQLAEIPTVTRGQAGATTTSTRRGASSSTGLDLYAGDDNLIFPFLELGGVGGICVHTHVVGPQVKEMVAPFRDGRRRGRARGSTTSSRPHTSCSGSPANPIAIKAALNLLGHEVGGLRLPLVEATEDEREARVARLPRRALGPSLRRRRR